MAKIIEISTYFGISLDALVLDRPGRFAEEMPYNKMMKPKYENMPDWESYASGLLTEYKQSLEEGLDLEKYKDLFEATAKLPKGEIKKKIGDVLFETVINAKMKENYPYNEPSDLVGIKALVKKVTTKDIKPGEADEKKIEGAWMGRICGCALGKPMEGVHRKYIADFLKDTGNYPLGRYILRADITDEIRKKYPFGTFNIKMYTDEIDGMPSDDDTNYTVMAQLIIEQFGKAFTPYDVSRAWLTYQGKDSYCTAERVAYCNFIKGYEPPQSALYKNPYREWIGAQIRGDYFGYINPGNPELAAEEAWRDASISHVKNGIYGEMFVAACLAAAAVTDDFEEIILAGLSEIPHTSRLFEGVMSVLEDFKAGTSSKECIDKIHAKYDEHDGHDWCHTISNAMIVAASVLYGKGDYGKSICMSVEAGFDTDCNAATVGSIVGMARGIDNIPEKWTKTVNDTLHTGIFGHETVKISDMVKMTVKHIKNN